MQKHQTPTTICHVEDDFMIRFCVAEMLSDNSGYAYKHAFSDGQELVNAWPLDPAPQVILLDLGLPRMDGHQVLKWLQQQEMNLPIVVLSGDPELHTLVAPYMKLNVRAFLDKKCTKEALTAALDDVIQRGMHCNNIMNAGLQQSQEDRPKRLTDLIRIWNSLSDRQKEFARLATDYHTETHKQLADRMDITLATAKTHARAIHTAFDIHSRVELVLIVKELRREPANTAL